MLVTCVKCGKVIHESESLCVGNGFGTTHSGMEYICDNRCEVIIDVKETNDFINVIGVLKEIEETYHKIAGEITLEQPYVVGDSVIKDGVRWFVTKVTPRLDGLFMKLDVEWEREI